MRHKDFHLEHFAIGLSRVKEAIAMCDLPPVEKGTFYSDRFKPNASKVKIKAPFGFNVFHPNG